MDAAARPVKNQEQCSPIWALSNKSSPEDDWFIVAGNMLLLSEPQPVNCDTVDSDYKGELMNNGFRFRREEYNAHGDISQLHRKKTALAWLPVPLTNRLLRLQWHSNVCPYLPRQTSPHSNRTRVRICAGSTIRGGGGWECETHVGLHVLTHVSHSSCSSHSSAHIGPLFQRARVAQGRSL